MGVIRSVRGDITVYGVRRCMLVYVVVLGYERAFSTVLRLGLGREGTKVY